MKPSRSSGRDFAIADFSALPPTPILAATNKYLARNNKSPDDRLSFAVNDMARERDQEADIDKKGNLVVAPGSRGGRQVKFTPERMNQIRNLVERGMTREQIAETIGVTVGSLQVTCSRWGISLRPPKFKTGVAQLDRVSAPPTAPVASAASEASVAVLIRYRNMEQAIPLPLTQDMIGQLALEAAFRDTKIADLIGELIMQAFGIEDPTR